MNIFADDTALILKAKNLTNLYQLASAKLSSLHDYIYERINRVNGIRHNDDKTDILIISPKTCRKIPVPKMNTDLNIHYNSK